MNSCSFRLHVPAARAAMAALGLCLFAFGADLSAQEPYDIVFSGGRVMDPETGVDSVLNVGIRGNEIVALSAEPLAGEVEINAGGLVVAPGFIDLHAHGQTNRANEFQARDGVTTALELESGVGSPAAFLAARRGEGAILNFGATVSHMDARAFAMPGRRAALEEALAAAGDDAEAREAEIGRIASLARYDPVDPAGYDALREALRHGLAEGALGIGMAHQYYPGATRAEVLRVFELSAETGAPIYTHVRSMGVEAMQEVVANAVVTGAPLHIVHANSSSLWTIATEGAKSQGFDISTEVYPYTAASTGIQSAIFDRGWQENLRISYGDLQWQDTGERLTEESFQRYRTTGGTVIIHMMRPEWIREALSWDFVMVASDGMPYAPGAHPRSAGTFLPFFGTLRARRRAGFAHGSAGPDHLMPARRLEGMSRDMTRKGRLQVGFHADITVFDPERILDTATFEDDLSYSVGVEHVLVNGQFVVRDGKNVPDARPGRAIVGKGEDPGS